MIQAPIFSLVAIPPRSFSQNFLSRQWPFNIPTPTDILNTSTAFQICQFWCVLNEVALNDTHSGHLVTDIWSLVVCPVPSATAYDTWSGARRIAQLQPWQNLAARALFSQ